MGKHRKRGQGRGRGPNTRRESRGISGRLPVSIILQLGLDGTTVQQNGITVNQLLTGLSTTYSYAINSISIATRHSYYMGSTMWQPYGYMRQDDSLQRSPLTAWRTSAQGPVSRCHLARPAIVESIYNGGKIPITIANDDLVCGVHARYVAGDATTHAIVAEFTFLFELSYSADLAIYVVSPPAQNCLTGVMSKVVDYDEDVEYGGWQPIDHPM